MNLLEFQSWSILISDELQTSIEEGISQHRVPEDDVLPHVRGGIKYNDEQYLVKLARPAVVTSEPVYANNHPEHYAVSTKYPFANNDDERSRGAVRKSRNLDIHALSGLKRNDTKQLIRKISFKYYPIISEFLKDFLQKGF